MAEEKKKISLEELVSQKANCEDELLKLRIQKATSQLKRSHLVKIKRKELARINTMINAQKNEQNVNA
ncbi:MAG: 50S ribosomal protein L29 [Pseudomonadota bacterium]